MEKRKFSYEERYAVWKSLGPNCRWCKTPVPYAECHIDHVIPEKLLDDDKLRQTTLKKYGLAKDFDINSFYNWIPVHPSCNLTKQATIMEGAPIFLELFTELRNKFADTSAICKSWGHSK